MLPLLVTIGITEDTRDLLFTYLDDIDPTGEMTPDAFIRHAVNELSKYRTSNVDGDKRAPAVAEEVA